MFTFLGALSEWKKGIESVRDISHLSFSNSSGPPGARERTRIGTGAGCFKNVKENDREMRGYRKGYGFLFQIFEISSYDMKPKMGFQVVPNRLLNEMEGFIENRLQSRH